MLNNYRITHRFGAVVAAYWVAFSIVLIVSLWGLFSAKKSLQMVHENAMKPALLAEASIDAIVRNRLQVLLAFQHAPESPLASVHDHPTSLHTDAIAAARVKANAIFEQMQRSVTDPQEGALLEAARAAREPWRAKLDATVNGIQNGDFSPAAMTAFLAAGRQEAEAATKALQDFRDYQVQRADQASRDAEQRYHLALLVFVLCAVIGGLPASLLTVALMKRMHTGFAQADAAATAIAGGDLSCAMQHSGKDEIGHLLTQMEAMRRSLQRVISEVQLGSNAIASASTQVAAGTQDLSNRTEQQAMSLEQTASASEELSSTVQHNADSANQANQLASSASQVASRGGEVMSQVVQTMDAIHGSSRKIADIITVIDGIAFQTNILALNAAVEAARAGEQGRGFAVVAGEVRSLAQRSAEAAKEIKALIDDSVAKVGIGSEQVTQAGNTMQEIVGGIRRVADIVAEIAAASREQSAGIGQINAAVTQLDSVTQQNAALVEQTSAASGSLQEQARKLAELAASFKLSADHTAGTPALPA